jgi:hypothetical protein
MTQDKINYRARGPRAALTRQTNHGRSKDGGLRIGDMERDSILSHGMSSFMYDSMMNRGDYYRMAICNHSGTIAIYNRNTQNFYSPIVDGPLRFESVDTQSFVPNLISKYGKNFSIVEVPYCLKLLMHELTTMNVQMRLITADTIESLTTAGKRSLGEFKTWVTKSESLLTISEDAEMVPIEAPIEAPNNKENVEKLLNQPLTDEEYKVLSEPLEEYEPPLTEAIPKADNPPNSGTLYDAKTGEYNLNVNVPKNNIRIPSVKSEKVEVGPMEAVPENQDSSNVVSRDPSIFNIDTSANGEYTIESRDPSIIDTNAESISNSEEKSDSNSDSASSSKDKKVIKITKT